MTIYAIGDIHGCYDELQALLELIEFSPTKDQLWFTGDLVNRGNQSLQVLRFIKNLKNAVVILGNHDIHLLELAGGNAFKNHTVHDVLNASDCAELMDWLRHRPLLYHAPNLNYVIAHAGVYPLWNLAQAKRYAQEVEAALQSPNYQKILKNLYGNHPNQWKEDLTGWERLRFIANAFTRMRFCTEDGQLDFEHTGKIGSQPAGYLPWFQAPNRTLEDTPIIFGHWAAIEGKVNEPTIFALDTGCVWGRHLTALRLGDNQRFSVRSKTKNVSA